MSAAEAASPQQLTPRSKVKALLAAIDDSSDDDSIMPKSCNDSRDTSLPDEISKGPKAANSSGNIRDDRGKEHGDEILDHIMLRAGLATKVHVEAPNNDPTFSRASLEPQGAYARIKQQLSEAQARIQPSGPDNVRKPGGNKAKVSSGAVAGNVKAIRPTSPLDGSLEKTPRHRKSPVSSRAPSISTCSPASEVARIMNADDENNEADTIRQPDDRNSRFEELVARKRAERKAKQDEAETQRAAKPQKTETPSKDVRDDASSSPGDSEDDVGHKFTQSARPTRKASKKALEEMTRETQRMNRNMQLAHQAKTKKKISKDSLFARFNFRNSLPNAAAVTLPLSSSSITSPAASDAERSPAVHDSPPTSPAMSIQLPQRLDLSRRSPHRMDLKDDDLPEMAVVLQRDKGGIPNVQARNITLPPHTSPKQNLRIPSHRSIRVSLPTDGDVINLDSDSEAEKRPAPDSSRRTKSRLDAFHRLPLTKIPEARSLLTLRALAHLNDPKDSRNTRNSSMSLGDMQASLRSRARHQALAERKAKIEELKARGILIQTTEEREQDQAEVEDLLEKARREAQELMQKEKRAASKSKPTDGETGYLGDTSEDDGDYEDNEAEDADVELSGSDEGEEGGAPVEDASGHSDADESGAEQSEVDSDSYEQKKTQIVSAEDTSRKVNVDTGVIDTLRETGTADSDAEDLVERPQQRRSRRRILPLDDEEDEPSRTQATEQINTSPKSQSDERLEMTIGRHADLPSLLKGSKAETTLGLTQAFAATMADTYSQVNDLVYDDQDSMDMCGQPPEPNLPIHFPGHSPQRILESQHSLVPETDASHRISLHFSQSQAGHEASYDDQSQKAATQYSEIPDPTQDAGFVLSSPAPERFISVPPSTVDTVLLSPNTISRTSEPRRKGRLYRRDCEESGATESQDDTIVHASVDAFETMKKMRKQAVDQNTFDKKKSEAKEMVEEQAQESEDDYAGMGGASDDESGGEQDELVEAMMDHGEVDVDERALASFYADKERASDEKAVEKLFKDINNGGLRRKRGAEFDLSDSDDDVEARRRRKQREFAKMRKALLADEKIGEIAEDPKKLAFLRAIEDRGDDEDLDFLDRPAQDSFYVEPDTQGNSQTLQVSATQEEEKGDSQRRHPLREVDHNVRPPATERRTAASSNKRPSTLAEIRDSVSFLTEMPGAMLAPDSSSSADESDETPSSNTLQHPRRTAANAVVDRLLLKRQSSSSLNSTSTRLAFYDPSTATNDGFKVPSLLRRATTNLSLDGAPDKHGISTYATTERAAGGGDKEGVVKQGGSKKSSVNYFVREQERQAVVRVIEKKRKEDREKRAKERREHGLGRLVGASGFD